MRFIRSCPTAVFDVANYLSLGGVDSGIFSSLRMRPESMSPTSLVPLECFFVSYKISIEEFYLHSRAPIYYIALETDCDHVNWTDEALVR